MKKNLYKIIAGALIGIGVIIGILISPDGRAFAAQTVCQVFNGCTGTGTIPAFGSVLVGQSNGTYGPQATSTLFSTFPLASTTGVLPVVNGGTGKTIFGQGWIASDGTTIISSTSPTVNYITATSTIASKLPYASTTALTVSGNAYFPGSGIWNSSGNVGIGTTTPGAMLGVQGNGIFAGNITATNITATSSLTMANVTGALQAINGLVSATSTLSTAYGGTGVNTAPVYGQILLGNASGGYTLTATSSLGLLASSTIAFGTQGQVPYYTGAGNTLNATSSLFIAQSGNVGINNVSPAVALDVGGFINTDQYSGYQKGGTTILTGSTTEKTILVGQLAGAALTPATNLEDTFLGYGSGANSTSTALTTCTGYNTCSSIVSTGNQNLDAYGVNSLNAVTTGSNLDGFGNNTLNKATTASSIVALGTQSCSAITTGSNDVCIGIQSELFDTTGVNNVFIGTGSGFNNISATSTTCGGYESCYGNSGGRYNAQGNTAFGFETLFNQATSSDYNVALGYRAGMGISTGQGNIDISPASSTSDLLSTGYGNIKICNNCQFPGGNATTSLDIGNLIYGSGLISTGATVNTAGLVGIATGTPSGTLAIAGFAGTLPFYISTTTATVASSTLFEVDGQGNLHLGGGTPVLSSCGTSPSLDADATDQSGTITVGSASATTCTLTFSAVKPAVPHCNVTSQTGTIAITYTESASALVITNAALTGDKVDYNCSLGH